MKRTSSISAWFARAFHTEVLTSARWPWVDYLRGIAIILVVYRHDLIGIERSGINAPAYLEKANLIFFSFRMPLFFILSGAFLRRSLAKRSWVTVLVQKFDNLLYPYFIWAFIQITLQIMIARMGFANAERTFGDYLDILYQPRNIDQFWYLPALFNCSLVYILTKSRLKFPVYAQLALGAVLYFVANIPQVRGISMIADWMSFYLYFALGEALSGIFFRPSTAKRLANPWTLLLATPFFVAAQVWFLANNFDEGSVPFLFVALVGCTTMVILAFLLEKWNVLRFLRVVGYHSLYIYVIHVIVSSLTRIVLVHFCHLREPHTLLLLGITTGVVVPIIFYNLLVDKGPLWFLFTPPRIINLKRPVHGMDSNR